MNWHLPTATTAKNAVVLIITLAFGAFRKEILDWLKGSWKSGHKGFRNWRDRHNFVRQVTKEEQEKIRKGGLVGLEASLYLLLEEYGADRISVMEYESVEGGGFLATCLVEALRIEMPSVYEEFQRTPISTELMHEIQQVERMPQRVRYVSDARVQDVAALRAAMLNAGAFSAYYQIISQPTKKPLRMLAISWRQPHELTANQLTMLRFSGIMCSNVLSNLDEWKETTTH